MKRRAAAPLSVACFICGNEPCVVTMDLQIHETIEVDEGKLHAGTRVLQHACTECFRQSIVDMRSSSLTQTLKARRARDPNIIVGRRLAGLLEAIDIMKGSEPD